ncbi:hypothetical protein B0H19DRAFT_1277686 [Mycena capillaripes]|nr:hypothetical protein B0H19DRAFT_1277686 [Mycena capillaripes]
MTPRSREVETWKLRKFWKAYIASSAAVALGGMLGATPMRESVAAGREWEWEWEGLELRACGALPSEWTLSVARAAANFRAYGVSFSVPNSVQWVYSLEDSFVAKIPLLVYYFVFSPYLFALIAPFLPLRVITDPSPDALDVYLVLHSSSQPTSVQHCRYIQFLTPVALLSSISLSSFISTLTVSLMPAIRRSNPFQILSISDAVPAPPWSTFYRLCPPWRECGEDKGKKG